MGTFFKLRFQFPKWVKLYVKNMKFLTIILAELIKINNEKEEIRSL